VKYLLDTNVLKEIGKPNAHENVIAWLDTVDDLDLAISVISLREIWKGIEKKRGEDATLATRLEVAVEAIVAAFRDRILPVNEIVAQRWGALLGRSEKHVDDTGLAATAWSAP
jgi:predicted nucleic acid-binding protein